MLTESSPREAPGQGWLHGSHELSQYQGVHLQGHPDVTSRDPVRVTPCTTTPRGWQTPFYPRACRALILHINITKFLQPLRLTIFVVHYYAYICRTFDPGNLN